MPKLLGSKLSVFHAVDKYLFQYPTELILHENVDCFIVVAEEFKQQYEPYNKPVLFIPHGVPSADDSLQVDFDLPIKNYIFYMGMIDGRLDYPLIEEYLINFPEEKFLFVGDFINVDHPVFKKLFINKVYSNLIHWPAVHALKLKKLIDQSKCCIAPMEQNWAGNMISHHKILQYLASGKAVFSPVFSAYTSFSDLLYMHNDKEKGIQSFKDFLEKGESPELEIKRKSFSQNHTYQSHVQKAIAFIYSSKK